MAGERATQSHRGRQRSSGRLDTTIDNSGERYLPPLKTPLNRAFAEDEHEPFRVFIISGGVPDWPRSHNTEHPAHAPPAVTSRLPVARDARIA